jgi:hypothetical protein
MTTSLFRTRGWLKGHPFFLLAALAACSHATTPTAPTPVLQPTTTAITQRPACGSIVLPTSSLFTVEALETGLPKRGQWRDGFDVADMNGDGKLDILHGPARKGNFQPAIFLGDGAGNFARWQSAHFPPLPYDYGDAKAADVNGDGVMDIALSSHLRGLTVLIHEANGHYAPWAGGLELAVQGTSEKAVFSSRSIALTDWNRDGKLDLMALSEGPSRMAARSSADATSTDGVALYLNRGGEWERATSDVPLSVFGTSLAIGDVNGDGHPDAFVGTELAGIRRLLVLGRRDSWTAYDVKALPDRAAVTATSLHDFTGDGRDEILYGTRYPESSTYCSALEFLRWSRAEEMPTPLWSELSRDAVTALAVADLNGDALDDLIALRSKGTILLFARGPNGFTRDLTIEPPQWLEGCNAYDVHAVDIDGDDRPELIVSYAGEATMTGNVCATGGGFAVWRVNSAR